MRHAKPLEPSAIATIVRRTADHLQEFQRWLASQPTRTPQQTAMTSRHRKLISFSLLSLFVPIACFAAEAPGQIDVRSTPTGTAPLKRERPSTTAELNGTAKQATAIRPTSSGSGVETFAGVQVPAGKSVTLDSALDYTLASEVGVTVICTTCTTNETSLSTLGFTLQARWKTATTASYVATEFKEATGFSYWDSGAAVFTVFGPQFRLLLLNTGDTTITVDQVTIFRRSK